MPGNMYVPASAVVIAVQWDGKVDTAKYLGVFAKISDYSVYILPDGKLKIDSDLDQRGGYIPVAIGEWLIVVPTDGPFRIASDSDFKKRYMPMPATEG